MHPAMRGRIEQLVDYHDELAQRAKDEHEVKQKATGPAVDAKTEPDAPAPDENRRAPRGTDKPKGEEPKSAELVLSEMHADVASQLRDLLKSQPPAPVIREMLESHPRRPPLR